jgi:hypothetical protein
MVPLLANLFASLSINSFPQTRQHSQSLRSCLLKPSASRLLQHLKQTLPFSA